MSKKPQKKSVAVAVATVPVLVPVSTAISIDKNVPVPETRGKYPWKNMKVGDSFFIACSKENIKKVMGNLHGSGTRHFPVRVQSNGKGVRVWRVK